MSSYEGLAASYDALTTDVGYEKRADFLEKLFRRSRIPVHTVLDLACGTGTMTWLLTGRGYELIGVDGSEEMLAAAGVKAHWVCDVCGKLFSDAEGKTETTQEALTIPATGHDTELVGAKDATCTEDGYTGDEVCKNCQTVVKQGEAIPATGHDTELVGAKDAICTEDGYTGDEVCKNCQTVVKKGEAIPALGHDYKDGKCSRCGAEEPTTPVEPGKPDEPSQPTQPEQPEKPTQPDTPATGDSSNMTALWVVLAVAGIGIIVLVVLLITKRKNKKD